MNTCEKQERVEHFADPFRTIQIHPTRRCNLACLHCYSSSAPHFRDMINLNDLKKFLSYAFDHGFNNISVSGGEPFLYEHLSELLSFSRSIGYHNTMASNGMLLKSARNQQILEYADLIAISIDGRKEIHDRIRGQEGAFEKMLEGVEVLRSFHKPFGFIHTVTRESWESLIWLGELAFELGAKLLQLHPLEMYGRAVEKLSENYFDDVLAHRTFILANYLESKYANQMVVQLDLLHREYIEAFPQSVNVFLRSHETPNRLSDVLDTIIVDEKGVISPIAYGFESSLTIGHVHDFSPTLFDDYLLSSKRRLEDLFFRTMEKILRNEEVEIINWNELLINESKALTAA